jgi:hypothetical protein
MHWCVRRSIADDMLAERLCINSVVCNSSTEVFRVGIKVRIESKLP